MEIEPTTSRVYSIITLCAPAPPLASITYLPILFNHNLKEESTINSFFINIILNDNIGHIKKIHMMYILLYTSPFHLIPTNILTILFFML